MTIELAGAIDVVVRPHRGLDLGAASFEGQPFAWLTPLGEDAPTVAGDWWASWGGGLMTTAGLDNVGVPTDGLPLHGTYTYGIATGEGRAAEAARSAVSSPLLEASIEGATGILLNITGGPEIGLFEVNEAAEVVTSAADQNANVIFGAVIDDALGDEVRVTVIATGFGGQRRRRRREPGAEAPVPASPASSPGFEMPDEALDVPSFLRDT